MPRAAASEHLGSAPNSNFVWRRDDDTYAVVQCLQVKFDDSFKAEFDCSEDNPDQAIFETSKVAEFRHAMRSVFGGAADGVPIVYARKITFNPNLVLIGTREALLMFLRSRPDVQKVMGIVSVFKDGFEAEIKSAGMAHRKRTYAIQEHEKSVVYMKRGNEQVASAKPLRLFRAATAEWQLGAQLVLQADLQRKLDGLRLHS
eukprot:2841564-Prymnesium_polylepis.1